MREDLIERLRILIEKELKKGNCNKKEEKKLRADLKYWENYNKNQ